MRNLIVGDIHGCYRDLICVLEKADFSSVTDRLFFTGDITDRGPDAVDTLRFFMSLEHFYPVLGNHDLWLKRYLKDGYIDPNWLYNGCSTTLTDFKSKQVSQEERSRMFLWMEKIPCARVFDRFLVIHGGPSPEHKEIAYYQELQEHPEAICEDLLWDRSFIRSLLLQEKPTAVVPQGYRLFLGHTPLTKLFISPNKQTIALDTGSGHPGGHITLMDMDTLESWRCS